ncbi:hypothetical protein [Streptomyces sp. NPDC004546]|uniref:hypothetical protein n=1 Tax=Streptomyces sp. NPDC004546 TaxID=3154282 RepID=UPI0033A1C33B
MTQTSWYDDPVALWASARVTELLAGHDDPPQYGSAEWQQLPGNDPKKGAAVITAAEMWRRYSDEDELVAWLNDAHRVRTPIASRKTIAELDALAKPKPARPVQAAPGWPPIAIPGRPGWYRHLVNGRQVDVQRTEQAA